MVIPRRQKCGWVLAVGLAVVAVAPRNAAAFPPYRSTDAETAEPFVLEARLGLLRFRREASTNRYSLPLLRLNYGLPANLEIVTEAEFDASAGQLADAAAGLKWVPWIATVSLGIEALVLLPIDERGGAGTETQLLMTARLPSTLLHLNAGGIYDARPSESEKGWRASVLGELTLDGWRPGLELFTRHFQGGDLEVQGGAGTIVQLGPVDLRVGAHLGITATAPDLMLNLWIASKFRTR